MIISAAERVKLLQAIIPLKGTFAIIEKKYKLKTLLEFTAKEEEEMDLKKDVNQISWTKNIDVDIDLTEYLDILKLAVDPLKAFYEDQGNWDDIAYSNYKTLTEVIAKYETNKAETTTV